jgi:hypothetical protein
MQLFHSFIRTNWHHEQVRLKAISENYNKMLKKPGGRVLAAGQGNVLHYHNSLS